MTHDPESFWRGETAERQARRRHRMRVRQNVTGLRQESGYCCTSYAVAAEARRKGTGGRPVWGPAETCSGLGKHVLVQRRSLVRSDRPSFLLPVSTFGDTYTRDRRRNRDGGVSGSHRLRGGLPPVCRGNIGTVRSARLAQRRRSSPRLSQRFLRLIGRGGTQSERPLGTGRSLGEINIAVPTRMASETLGIPHVAAQVTSSD